MLPSAVVVVVVVATAAQARRRALAGREVEVALRAILMHRRGRSVFTTVGRGSGVEAPGSVELVNVVSV